MLSKVLKKRSCKQWFSLILVCMLVVSNFSMVQADETVSIDTISAAKSKEEAVEVTVQGVVTFVEDSNKVYVQDTTGAILIYGLGNGTDYAMGDELKVTGTLATYNNEREIVVAESTDVTKVGTGTLPDAEEVTLSDIGEATEGLLVQVLNVKLTSIGETVCTLTDENDVERDIYVEKAEGYNGADFTEGERYDVVGIATQYQDNYQVKLRMATDLTLIEVAEDEETPGEEEPGEEEPGEEVPDEEEPELEVYTTSASIEAKYDDMEEKADGSADEKSSDIELTWEGDNEKQQTIGLRFANLSVPKDSTILSAYIQFTVDEPNKNYGTPEIHIYAVDEIDAPVFKNEDFTVTSKKTTTDHVIWTNIPEWTVEAASGEDQRTSDLSSLVQIIIDKDGWANNNAIAFIMTGTGTRTAESFEGGGTEQAGKLVIEYTNPEGKGEEPEVEVPEEPEELGEYVATDITFALGVDESEMNFAWYSTGETTNSAIVEIALAEDMTGTDFPTNDKTTFTGTTSVVKTGTNTNKVVVTGLVEKTEYVYHVGDGVNWSDGYTFTTGDSESYSFFVVGDPQIGSSGVAPNTIGWQDTMTKAMAHFGDTDFIVSVGDQVNNSNSEEEYTGFFSPVELRALPLVTVQGNHDNSAKYLDHFNNPNMSTEYGTTTAGGDYSFVYGDTLFVGLNSNNTTGASHQAFLEQAVEDNPTVKWKVVMLHHAIYSSASHSTETSIIERRKDFFPVFDALDIDMVLMGHDHCYTRTYQMIGDEAQLDQVVTEDGAVINPEGTFYLTLNSASGSKYYTMKSISEDYAAVREQLRVPTFSRIEVDEVSITMVTYRTDTMEEVDRYAVLKDPSIIVVDPDKTRTITSVIKSNLDDMEERVDGSLDYDSSDLELVWEKDGDMQQEVGIRFADLAIPAGAIILESYIQFTVDETKKNYGTTDLKIYAIESVDTEGFEVVENTVTSKIKTEAYVQWSDIPEWTVEHEAGIDQQTPDLSSLIQDIVDKEGWAKNNAIGFILTGSGTRCAESYEGGGSEQAPQLVVTYMLADNGNSKIRVDDSILIQEEIDSIDYYYSVSEMANMNALDLTFDFDSDLLEFVAAEVIGIEDALIEATSVEGSVRVVAGFMTPVSTLESQDIIKLSFSVKGDIIDETSAVVYITEALAAAVGINDAVSTTITEDEAGIMITSYRITCDVNGDELLSINDLSLALELYRDAIGDANWADTSRADVNMDGIIDVVDLTLIINYILK